VPTEGTFEAHHLFDEMGNLRRVSPKVALQRTVRIFQYKTCSP
jgi:hypothetical protein